MVVSRGVESLFEVAVGVALEVRPYPFKKKLKWRQRGGKKSCGGYRKESNPKLMFS